MFPGRDVKTGLVVDPRTKALVLNGEPGHLQFYSLQSDQQLFSVSWMGLYQNFNLLSQVTCASEFISRLNVTNGKKTLQLSHKAEFQAEMFLALFLMSLAKQI